MLQRFLRLFWRYRAMEKALAGAEETAQHHKSGALSLHNELRHAERTIDGLRRELEAAKDKAAQWEKRFLEAEADSKKVREQIADFASMIGFRRKVFDQQPALPSKPLDELKPVPKSRIHARVLVQRGEQQFRQELRDYLKHEQEKQQAAQDEAQRGTPAEEPEPEPEPAA